MKNYHFMTKSQQNIRKAPDHPNCPVYHANHLHFLLHYTQEVYVVIEQFHLYLYVLIFFALLNLPFESFT